MQVVLNNRMRTMTIGGTEIGPLSPRQWKVMVLLSEAGEPVRVERLAEELYGDRERDGAVRSVIMRIRELMQEAGVDGNRIRSIQGHGYVIT